MIAQLNYYVQTMQTLVQLVPVYSVTCEQALNVIALLRAGGEYIPSNIIQYVCGIYIYRGVGRAVV